MKPEEQRIAIAEACGWTQIFPSAYAHLKRLSGIKPGAMRVVHRGEYIESYSDVPDFCNDRNAMADAEMVLTPEQQPAYTHALCTMLCASERWTWRCTAAQRAEAFLKTIGKWTQ